MGVFLNEMSDILKKWSQKSRGLYTGYRKSPRKAAFKEAAAAKTGLAARPLEPEVHQWGRGAGRTAMFARDQANKADIPHHHTRPHCCGFIPCERGYSGYGSNGVKGL